MKFVQAGQASLQSFVQLLAQSPECPLLNMQFLVLLTFIDNGIQASMDVEAMLLSRANFMYKSKKMNLKECGE